MDLVEKHRTFLFMADVPHEGQEFPTVCGRPREGRMVLDGVGIGPGEGRLLLPGWDKGVEEEAPSQPGFNVVGRSTIRIWSGETGDFHRFDALTYPDFRSFTMLTWKGQNFGAFSTEWESYNSPVLGNSTKLTPLVDNCGVLVGYFQQGVSTDNLYATPSGEIFYAAMYGSYMLTADRVAGKDLWLSDSGEVTSDSAQAKSKHKIPGGNKADIMVDIDGFVLAINCYVDPPIWTPSQNPFIAALGFLIPDKPKGISEECLPGGAEEGSDECLEEYSEMILNSMDWAFLIIDIVSLGTSAVARKVALKVLKFGTRARKAVKAMKGAKEAGEAILKGARAAEKAASLVLDAPKLVPPKLTTAAVKGGKRGKLVLAAEKSGKKANLSPLSQSTGMTNMAIRDVRYKMMKNGGRVRFRPAGTARKLRKRGAVPKWEELKMKTINDDDIVLGAAKSGKSQPGYFDPKLPDPKLQQVNPDQYKRLMARYEQRKTEFRELAEKVKQYQKDGDIVVENGIVKDGPTGKDIAGDYDIYEILDNTGKRIPPSDPRYERIFKDLEGRRIQAQHRAHVDWNPTDPFEIKIKDEIINRHRTKEPLFEFREDGSVWEVFAD